MKPTSILCVHTQTRTHTNTHTHKHVHTHAHAHVALHVALEAIPSMGLTMDHSKYQFGITCITQAVLTVVHFPEGESQQNSNINQLA